MKQRFLFADINSDPTGDQTPANHTPAAGISHQEPVDRDPTLDAVFSALGMDLGYLGDSQMVSDSASEESIDDRPWVLHVDDDDAFRNIVRLRLEAAGICVANASDGIEGIHQAFRQRVGAIILDFEMPNGRGDYVLGRLKGNPVTMDIPVIVLTGMRDPLLSERLLEMGAAACLRKPPQFDVLIEQIEQLVCAAAR